MGSLRWCFQPCCDNFSNVPTLLQHCYAALRKKSSLRILPCNITFIPGKGDMVYRPSVQGPENYACEIFTVYLRIFCHKCILPWKVQTSFFRRSTTHVADPLLIKSLNNFRIQVRKNVGSFNKRRLTSTIFPWFLVTKEQNLQWTETTGNEYVSHTLERSQGHNGCSTKAN